MTSAIQNASVFKSGNIVRIYPGFRLSESDLVTKTRSSMSKLYGSGASGIRVFEVIFVTVKEDVLAEMHKAFGTEGLLHVLRVHLRDAKKFSDEFEEGNFKGLAMEIATQKSFDKEVKVRKGTASKTILEKVQAAITRIDAQRDACVNELSNRCLERLSTGFGFSEMEYQDLMISMIDRNPQHFDEASGGKASDLLIKIKGLQAQLKEAENQLQDLRNAQVLKFVDGDGKINEHKVKGEVLEKIAEKAKGRKFFDSPFSSFG